MSDSQTPPTAAMFNVLLSLADGEKHGYGILKEVEEQTSGEVQLQGRLSSERQDPQVYCSW